VAFEILPAIDVSGGRLVSVSEGRVRPLGAFGGSPVSAAEAFVAAGASWLHLVDVDRAQGRPPDTRLLGELAWLGVPVQASGGIVTAAAAKEALQAGAARVVLGSALLEDRELLARLLADLDERAVIGIEADGDAVRPRSAGAATLPLAGTLKWLRTLGPARYLLTDLSRVARLGGPDLEGVRAAAASLGRPVLVAGGVRGVEDVLALRSLGARTVQGCVLGRALYEGLDLREVLEA
jgi:phosphoribosylformimino-5-aminoimidazole carboxamide ribonucleotide (ProFAR) isomerase